MNGDPAVVCIASANLDSIHKAKVLFDHLHHDVKIHTPDVLIKVYRGHAIRLDLLCFAQTYQISTHRKALHAIGLAYAEAGACYFRKRDLAAAKTILKKGLEIVPEHGELTERLRIVEEEEERVRR